MKLIKYTMIALLATAAVSVAAPDKGALMARENAAWQAFKEKDAAGFKKVVSPKMIGVYDDGISTLKKELADMKKWDMKSFSISDYKVLASGADTMVSSYKVTLAGTFDGKDAGGTYYAGSVWQMMNGEWRAIFHTNVKPAGPAPTAQKKE
jgi:hypothetical protein